MSACCLILLNGCKKDDVKPIADKALQPKNEIQGKGNALPHTKKFSAEVASSWYHLLTDITRSTPYNPPQTLRIFAYTGLALYESVVPGMPSYQSMYTHFTGNTIASGKKKDYYWPAAANAAVARISSRLLGNFSATPNLASIQQTEQHFNNKFKALVSADELQFSNEFGQYVADKIYEWSTTDGTLAPNGLLAPCPPYTVSGTPGSWVPTPPFFFPAAGACQGSLRTFIPGIAATVFSAPPPSFSTDPNSAFYKMANEVYMLKTNATSEEQLISEAWRDKLGFNYNTPAHMLKLTSEIIDKERLNLEEAVTLYAKQGIAMFDAVVANFNVKYHYALMRPVTFIQNVIGHTGFDSQYPTPQHPAYPATAVSAAGAAVAVLESVWGSHYSFVDDTQETLYGNWSYSSFNGLLVDVGVSRTHSGLNYTNSVEAGIKLGRKVGEMTEALPFKK